MTFYDRWLELSNAVDNLVEEPYRQVSTIDDVQRLLDALKAEVAQDEYMWVGKHEGRPMPAPLPPRTRP